MQQNTGTPLVTRPKNPCGPVIHCLCGRWNDSGLVRECPDCGARVYSFTSKPAPGWSLYELEDMAKRDHARELSATAAYALGMFVAHDVREAVR